MSSVMQKLITPMASGPAEPPRNKVTVVGVGMVGMACAVSVLLRVSLTISLSYCYFTSLTIVLSVLVYSEFTSTIVIPANSYYSVM